MRGTIFLLHHLQNDTIRSLTPVDLLFWASGHSERYQEGITQPRSHPAVYVQILQSWSGKFW